RVAQVTFGIGMEGVAGSPDGYAQTDGGEHVLQGASRPDVHVHVARGSERQSRAFRERGELTQPGAVVRPRQKLRRDPRPAGKARGDETRVFQGGVPCIQSPTASVARRKPIPTL